MQKKNTGILENFNFKYYWRFRSILLAKLLYYFYLAIKLVEKEKGCQFSNFTNAGSLQHSNRVKIQTIIVINQNPYFNSHYSVKLLNKQTSSLLLSLSFHQFFFYLNLLCGEILVVCLKDFHFIFYGSWDKNE
jgi:hypothetical protein